MFLFGDDELQGIDVLAQQSDIVVFKEGLDEFDRNVILKKDIEKITQLLEQVRQGLGSADNVIYVGMSLGIEIPKNVIYFTLNVGHEVNRPYA